MKHRVMNPQPNSPEDRPLVSPCLGLDLTGSILQRSLAVSRYQPGSVHAGRNSTAHSPEHAAVVPGEPSWLQGERVEAREQPGPQLSWGIFGSSCKTRSTRRHLPPPPTSRWRGWRGCNTASSRVFQRTWARECRSGCMSVSPRTFIQGNEQGSEWSFINVIKAKMVKRFNALRAVSGKAWGANTSDLRALYLAYIRACADYAAAGWMPGAAPANSIWRWPSARRAGLSPAA